MLREQTKRYISSLGDNELVEYVMVGRRMYEADAIAFAKEELERRGIPEEAREPLVERAREKVAQIDLTSVADEVDPRAQHIVCQTCGIEAPTRFSEFEQNIGLLFLRITGGCRGHYCKRCTRQHFWRTTAITFFAGWWGVISFILTPIFLICNVVTYLRTWKLADVPPDACAPTCGVEAAERLEPYSDEIHAQLDEAVDVNDIARAIAEQADVTPGEAWCHVIRLLGERKNIRA